MVMLLMMCFPIVEDIQGFIRLGDPVVVSQEYTHGMILTALKFTTPSDSYICSEIPIDQTVLNRPEDLNYTVGGYWNYKGKYTAFGYGLSK